MSKHIHHLFKCDVGLCACFGTMKCRMLSWHFLSCQSETWRSGFLLQKQAKWSGPLDWCMSEMSIRNAGLPSTIRYFHWMVIGVYTWSIVSSVPAGNPPVIIQYGWHNFSDVCRLHSNSDYGNFVYILDLSILQLGKFWSSLKWY